jgi:hypothetical protein
VPEFTLRATSHDVTPADAVQVSSTCPSSEVAVTWGAGGGVQFPDGRTLTSAELTDSQVAMVLTAETTK